MKKADPSRRVTVIERNAPDATFGWGVVFSEETMGALRDADYESYLQISDRFARWDAIDIVYRDERVRSRGHVFSAIGRKVLLSILQERCRELGVELAFGQEVADLSLFDDRDLVVAADGVHSLARRLHGDAFGASVDIHRSKYIWFGTNLVFDAFTFIFRRTDHGMFQVHGYPFDAATSTFIVECNEATWERAGLKDATEEQSIAFCQDLFAPELAGHKLMSNRSTWTSFPTVRCHAWHLGRMVLVGDAAHTAHFTIGSGTKLAMEDAIALSNAFLRHGEQVDRALVEYELERQPVVERFQEAARESATYFEDVDRYRGFEPLPFAFNLLTRSGRITHRELEKRDPAFVARVDRWFAASSHADRTDLVPVPPAFVPWNAPRDDVTVGGTSPHDDVTVRVTLSPTLPDTAVDGCPGAEQMAALVAAGKDRPGIIVIGPVAVRADGRITPGSPGLYSAEQEGAWSQLLTDLRQVSGPPMLMALLSHAGRRGATLPRDRGVDRAMASDGWELLAPSAIPYTRRGRTPAQMEESAMSEVADAFANAARRAARVGFDAVQVDMGLGYLLGSFLSPLSNRRSDRYGGSLENRARFPLAVFEAIRAVWPLDRSLAVRLTASDWYPGGIEGGEAAGVAAMLKAAGCDLVEVVAGQTIPNDRPAYGRFHLVPLSDRVRNDAGVATMVAGNLTTLDDVNTVLAAGRADICVLDPRIYRTER
jgi:anthraniloyl-CoA monooxygenase